MKSLCILFMRCIMEKDQPELLNRLRSRKNFGLVTPFFCSAHSKVVSHLCSLYISSVIFSLFAFDKNDLTPPMRHVPMGLIFILSFFFYKISRYHMFYGKFLLLISVNLFISCWEQLTFSASNQPAQRGSFLRVSHLKVVTNSFKKIYFEKVYRTLRGLIYLQSALMKN